MEVWRRKVLEPLEREQELTVDVDAVPGEFNAGDDVEIEVIDDEEEEEEELDEVKTNCHAYNPAHKGSDGKFVDPDKHKGSYSMAAPDSDSPEDCTWGQSSRKSANRSRQAVKKPCGRGAKYRCRDSSPKWQQESMGEGVEEQDAAYIRGIISQELRRALQSTMKQRGCSFAAIVKAINMMAAAEKAELFGKDEK
jgi:hypothetical protein